MPASEFFKRNVMLVCVGVISAVLVTRFEPFKSNFALAILAGLIVGVIGAMIEVAARSVAKKRKWRAYHDSVVAQSDDREPCQHPFFGVRTLRFSPASCM